MKLPLPSRSLPDSSLKNWLLDAGFSVIIFIMTDLKEDITRENKKFSSFLPALAHGHVFSESAP